jgi:putative cell wall-binding protein
MRKTMMAVIAVVLVGVLAPASADAQTAEPWMVAHKANWLAEVNWYRAWSGLPPVVEDAELTYGAFEHARCVAMTGEVGHTEYPSSPWYTTAGAPSASQSNVTATDVGTIDTWMGAPFHAIGILRPNLERVGYGDYRGPNGAGAALDVIGGLDYNAPPAYPVTFPGDGAAVPVSAFFAEWPDPAAACGYGAPAGLPLVAMFGRGASTATAHSLVDDDGRPIDHCVIDASTFAVPGDTQAQATGRAILNGDGAVIVVPREPLRGGHGYRASVSSGASSVTWSFSVGIPRLSGANRAATAAAVARQGWPAASPTVYVATGQSFPDALAVGPRAAKDKAPLLLTDRCDLPPETATELTRLRPTSVVVVGGTATVCDDVVRDIRTATGATVRRLAGGSRAETAAAISSDGWPSAASVYLASSMSFADSLSSSPAAARDDAPLLLADRCALPDVTAAELTRLRPQHVVIAGGAAAICEDVVADVARLTGATLTRVAGADRYATSAAFAEGFSGATEAYIASGNSFADGVAGGPLAALRRAPILLVASTTLPYGCSASESLVAEIPLAPAVSAALSELRVTRSFALGGLAAICTGTVMALARQMTPPSS